MLLRRAQATRGGAAEAQADAAPATAAQRGVPSPQPTPARPAEPTAEAWHRWKLAPGVELHVRANVAARRTEVLEQAAPIWQATERAEVHRRKEAFCAA